MAKLTQMRKGVKVRRVVRRFELWPVAKVAFFFHLLCYLLTLGVLTGVWFVADRMGTVRKLEKLATGLGWDTFEVQGDVLFRSAAMIGASLAVVATIATVTLAFFYNMLSGIFGGLVLSVLQEHTDGSSGSRRQRRRGANRGSSDNPVRRSNEHGHAAEPDAPVRPSPSPSLPPRRGPISKPVIPNVSPVRTRASMAIPEGWEPDTVKSLFGDGDLDRGL